MKVRRIDHIVIRTKDLNACLNFYGKILGLEIYHNSKRYEIRMGDSKISVQDENTEAFPLSKNIQYGCVEVCLVVESQLEKVIMEIEDRGGEFATDILDRHGALGPMRSVYIYDPDGNLVELSSYASAE